MGDRKENTLGTRIASRSAEKKCFGTKIILKRKLRRNEEIKRKIGRQENQEKERSAGNSWREGRIMFSLAAAEERKGQQLEGSPYKLQ